MRGDQVYAPGILTLGDIVKCFPFEDPIMVVRVSGAALVRALENGVSKLPALEGWPLTRGPGGEGEADAAGPCRPFPTLIRRLLHL